ncbi:hypothetical protein C8R43DRAFT_901672 [Mycena crocata]|nr:hypothetical protein C8R43DRAFT_901672 [Mycena crocata]
MKVRWNTTLAELKRAKMLQPAFDAIVDKLPDGLTGKPRKVAQARKEKWQMFETDWEFVDKLISALQVLENCTLEFSKKTVPTISKILPLYKLMEVSLTKSAEEYRSDPTLHAALLAGAKKATKYIDKALVGDYVLLGAVLHPAIRLSFFQSDQWDSSVAIRGRRLLLQIVKKYAAQDKSRTVDTESTNPDRTTAPGPTSVFAMAMALQGAGASTKPVSDGKDEVDLYLGNISPVPLDFDDPLGWWKVELVLSVVCISLILLVANAGHIGRYGTCCAGYSRDSWCQRFSGASFFKSQKDVIR